jgi:two-component system chemotaxis response regulator CheY
MALERRLPILIVDDYKTMLRIVRNLLKQIDFDDIDDATDGPTALRRLKQRTYGLVIADWNMRPMTGLELLQAVRADAALAATPFIMITAASSTENVVTAKGAGVDNYLVQPFNAATLETKIAHVMAGRARAPSLTT